MDMKQYLFFDFTIMSSHQRHSVFTCKYTTIYLMATLLFSSLIEHVALAMQQTEVKKKSRNDWMNDTAPEDRKFKNMPVLPMAQSNIGMDQLTKAINLKLTAHKSLAKLSWGYELLPSLMYSTEYTFNILFSIHLCIWIVCLLLITAENMYLIHFWPIDKPKIYCWRRISNETCIIRIEIVFGLAIKWISNWVIDQFNRKSREEETFLPNYYFTQYTRRKQNNRQPNTFYWNTWDAITLMKQLEYKRNSQRSKGALSMANISRRK